MRIVHFTLGLPPARSGGLTKYTTDLMIRQTPGNDVFLLYPGDYNLKKSSEIRYERTYNDIDVYTLTNPPLVPLLHGIKNPQHIYGYDRLAKKAIVEFLKEVKPDIFHVHTLMGLPLELIRTVKECGVKTVFSSHDYFGLCPKVNFIDLTGSPCPGASADRCSICNINAPSDLILKLRNNSKILQFKNNRLALTLKEHFAGRDKPAGPAPVSISENVKPIENVKKDDNSITAYEHLLSHYKEIYALFDLFHFNSSVTYSRYNEYLDIHRHCIINISHSGIKDRRESHEVKEDIVRINFIGSTAPFKGYPVLVNAINKVIEETDKKIELNIWGGEVTVDPPAFAHFRGKYKDAAIDHIYDNCNLLVVPSIWKETFSLVALEALSFGVPVLLSSNVGAGDIFKQYSSFASYDTEYQLIERLKKVIDGDSEFKDYSKKILDAKWHFSLDNHISDIEDMYQNILRD